MTDRRSGPPLFDLMRERGDRPDAPKPRPQSPAKPTTPPTGSTSSAQPVAPAEAKPQPKPATGAAGSMRQTAWDTSGGVSRAERSAAAMLDEEIPTDTGIQLSTTRFYTMIAVALVLVVAAWAGGYKIGFSDGKDAMSQYVGDQPIVNPLSNGQASQPQPNQPANNQPQTQRPAATNPSQAQDPATTGRNQPQANQPPVGNAARPGTAIMTPSGFVNRDPRVSGMNYLVLATLPTEQAADAISFLKTNGQTVIGVPELDSGGKSANNPSRYTLYSLGLAIPGNQWSNMSAQRRDHQQLIANLGARWQRERRGGSDFSQTNWEKYEP